MAASFESLVFDIIARDKQASAAFDRFRRSVDDTSGSVDRSSQSLDRNQKALDKHKESSKSAMGAVAGLGLALAPIAGAATAAGAGFAAFGALAVPSVMKITTAMSGPGGLAAAWETLDNRQRNAALGVQALGREYTTLARAMEPQVFQVFNQGLSLANSLLGPVGQLARTSGLGIADFLANFSADSGIQQFVTFLSTQARPAFDLLGQDITHLSHAIFALLESFAGVGIMELKALTGVFTALDVSLSWLSEHAPGLTSAGLAIGGIALALSKIGALGAVGGALKFTGLTSIAGDLKGFTAATRGATLAQKGMLASTIALDAVSPAGWFVLAAGAAAGLAWWLSSLDKSTAETIRSLEASSKATGFNAAGYDAAGAAIGRYAQATKGATVNVVNMHSGLVTSTTNVGELTGATRQLTDAQHDQITKGRNIASFLQDLQDEYGLTRGQAASLAAKSGVLATEVGKGGHAMALALGQTRSYADANLQAQRPTTQLAADMETFANKTLTAKDRVKGLTDALSLFFDPAVAADQDVIALKNDQITLARALDASGGKTGLLTQKQRDARGAFDAYITQVKTAAESAFGATGRTSSYTGVINKSLPFLERAAGHNKTLRQEIQRLVDTERRLRSEHFDISVTGTGHWNVLSGGTPQPGGGGPTPRGGAARGMFISTGTPGVDDQLILAQKDELIIPPGIVRSGAVDHLRGMIPGFAAGGVVGSYAGALPGLSKWMISENAQTVRAIESSVASAVVAGIRAMQSSGGGGAGVAQWAPLILQALAMLHQSSANLGPVEHRMMQESGGNPRAINLTDSNAAAGDPSRGLMQTIGSTFAAYRSFSLPNDIYNPLANIYAGLNYAINAYPGRTLASVMLQPGGYDRGGFLPPGLSLAYNGTGRPEPVGPSAGTVININVTVAPGGEREAGRHIVNAIRKYEQANGSGWRS